MANPRIVCGGITVVFACLMVAVVIVFACWRKWANALPEYMDEEMKSETNEQEETQTETATE